MPQEIITEVYRTRFFAGQTKECARPWQLEMIHFTLEIGVIIAVIMASRELADILMAAGVL